MYERLLVGLDGTQGAERVLEHVEALATAFGSTITLVRVIESAEMLISETSAGGPAAMGDLGTFIDPTPVLDAERDTADEYLQAVAARLGKLNFKVSVERLEGPTSEAIVEFARTIDASLILLTTHGRAGLRRLVLGSVADSVLRHAPCPLLLVRRDTDTDDEPAIEPAP